MNFGSFLFMSRNLLELNVFECLQFRQIPPNLNMTLLLHFFLHFSPETFLLLNNTAPLRHKFTYESRRKSFRLL